MVGVCTDIPKQRARVGMSSEVSVIAFRVPGFGREISDTGLTVYGRVETGYSRVDGRGLYRHSEAAGARRHQLRREHVRVPVPGI